MVYYKIPLSSGKFDYPAGCLLCCAYSYGGYMYCKFESVTTVGSGWVSITQSEFDVRCPDFPTPEGPTEVTPIEKGGTGATTAADARANLGASATGHNHSGEKLTPANLDIYPGAGAGHGGYIDFHYNNGGDDYTTRLVESNGHLKINNKKIFTAENFVAIYSEPVTFSNGKCTYKHSAIKESSVVLVQRISDIPGSATTSMFATASANGSVTIVTDNLEVTSANLNILIFNL